MYKISTLASASCASKNVVFPTTKEDLSKELAFWKHLLCATLYTRGNRGSKGWSLAHGLMGSNDRDCPVTSIELT